MQKYNCKKCGGELFWNSELGLLKCEYCDSEFMPSDFEDTTLEEEKKINKEDIMKEEQNVKDNKEENIDNYITYKCSHCGAEVIVTDKTVSTTCIYCKRALLLTNKMVYNFRPKKIIPFSITKEKAIDLYKNFVRSCFLAPKVFKEECIVNEIQGLYVPFFLHSMNVESNMNFECFDIEYHRSGYDRIKRTNVYHVDIDLEGEYKDIPTDASKKIDNLLMDSLEPFDYNNMVDFNPAYMAGYFAEQYDEDVEITKQRAEERIEDFLENASKNELSQYEVKNNKSKKFEISNVSDKYVMLPVWILSVEYKNKVYTIAVNGQTGKVSGKLPMSKLKLYSLTGLGYCVIPVIFTILNCIGIM